MSVRFKLFGVYRLLLGEELYLDISQNETLSSILNIIDAKIKDIPGHIAIINDEGILLCNVTVNDTQIDANAKINDGDEIKIMPIIGGG